MTITIYIHPCYVTTGFQRYKQSNNWLNYVHVLVDAFSCKRWERRKTQGLQVLIQALRN